MARATILGAAAALAILVGCGPSDPPPVRVVPKPAPSEPIPVRPAAPDPPPEPPPAPPVRVFYLTGEPTWDFQYLTNLLVRDKSTRTSTLLMSADAEAPQRRSADVAAIDARTMLDFAKSLGAFDVVFLGDVDPRSLAATPEEVKRSLSALREFVEKGGGLAVLAGAMHVPSKLAGTPLEDVLPVQLDRELEIAENARVHDAEGLDLHVTADGEKCPYVDVAGDRATSKRMWETDGGWKQYWAFPVHYARPGAQVLLETSEGAGEQRPRVPVVVASTFGRGRVLYVGVDELWRMRKEVGDRYFRQFWIGAARWLASAPR